MYNLNVNNKGCRNKMSEKPIAVEIVEGMEKQAVEAGKTIGNKLGENVELSELQELFEEFPTDWHKNRALRGINEIREEKGWEPLQAYKEDEK